MKRRDFLKRSIPAATVIPALLEGYSVRDHRIQSVIPTIELYDHQHMIRIHRRQHQALHQGAVPGEGPHGISFQQGWYDRGGRNRSL